MSEEMRVLPCDLTHEEKLELAEALSVAAQRLNEEQVAQDQMKSRLKERMTAVQNDYNEIFNKIRYGKEDREVACQVDISGGEVKIWRLDTMELVERRPATEEEMQMSLPAEPEVPPEDDDPTPVHHPV
jgi:FixJ family two-component response regulator